MKCVTLASNFCRRVVGRASHVKHDCGVYAENYSSEKGNTKQIKITPLRWLLPFDGINEDAICEYFQVGVTVFGERGE